MLALNHAVVFTEERTNKPQTSHVSLSMTVTINVQVTVTYLVAYLCKQLRVKALSHPILVSSCLLQQCRTFAISDSTAIHVIFR